MAQLVWLDVRIPRSLPGRDLLIRVRCDQTWSDMIYDELGIRLPDHLRVSNYKYRRTNEANNGYCGRLDDQIGEFVGSFQTRRGCYKAIIFSVRERRGTRNGRYRRADVQRNPQVGNLPVVQRNQGQGINPRPISFRDVVRARFNNFNGHFLRRVQAEILALRRNGI